MNITSLFEAGCAAAHTLRKSLVNWRTSYRVERKNPHVLVHPPNAWLYDNLEKINFGSQVSIGPFCEIVVLSNSLKSRIGGQLTIGNRTVIGAFCNIRAAGGKVTIGDDCLIAQNVSLIAANHLIKPGQPYWQQAWDEQKTGIIIGNNCWIGAGVTILPGCAVGDNAILAAGCVVTTNVPANEIWGNIPARLIGKV